MFSYLWWWMRYYYRKLFSVDTVAHQKCPACGLVQAPKVVFENQYQKLLSTCDRCKAVWAVDPLIPVEAWKVQGIEEWSQHQEALAAEEFRQMQQREIEVKGIRR